MTLFMWYSIIFLYLISSISLMVKLYILSCTYSFVHWFLFQFARQFSRDEPLTFDWVCRHVSWPLAQPKNIKDLAHLEAVHDVLDLYLWLR